MTGPETETHAIIVAAGRGERSGLALPKQFQPLRDKPMLRHSVEAFLTHDAIDHIWVVIGGDQDDLAKSALAGLDSIKLITGGASRQESVFNGLAAVKQAGGTGHVLIHDAARPFLKAEVVDRLLEALKPHDGAIPVLPVVDTIIAAAKDISGDTMDRESLRRVQTPQAFDLEKLYAAHQSWTDSRSATDDAQIFRSAGHSVALVAGDERLKKYTTADDFGEERGSAISQIRTGSGFDVHRLAAGEELWLGGIEIEHDKGLAGHSDADVLLHALTDALLGAIGEGDIGDHFPPSDPQWRGAASHKFVEHAARLIAAKGGTINNVDMTIICEAPKIKPHRDEIRSNVAKMLDLSLDQVSVKATTTEGLGFTGRKEGIAAQAIATLSMEAL